MSRSARLRRARGVLASALALACAATLASCAAEPVTGWQPASIESVPGITLAAQPQSVANAETSEVPEPTDTFSPESTELLTGDVALDLYEGRIRNDDLGFSARFIYVPGAQDFNNWINARLWAAIGDRSAATGVSYQPAVYDVGAGLGDRGCVPGSISWSASEVLTRPQTAPVGGNGTAITCEVTAAFGDLIEVRLRTVTGSVTEESAKVQSDHTLVVYANTTTGGLVEIVDEWNEDAPEKLWLAAIELLRRDAGALSTAPIEPPDSAQLLLAKQALERSQDAEDGGLSVTIAPGIDSPELAGLGIGPTEVPTALHVSPSIALTWSNPEYTQLHDAIGQPFDGELPPVHTVPIDCGLLPCVALTYDDGPGDYTKALLDTLEAEQARATFFMMGGKANAWSATISRVAEEGHEIGSHTMNHPDLTDLPLEEAKAQVLDAAAALNAVSGQQITTFRPPYGEVNEEIIEAVGMPAILWSVDTNDWQKPGAEALIERGVAWPGVGGIILFHDIHEETVEVAGQVVRGLHDRGFELVTVTQLFGGQVPAGRVSAR